MTIKKYNAIGEPNNNNGGLYINPNNNGEASIICSPYGEFKRLCQFIENVCNVSFFTCLLNPYPNVKKAIGASIIA